MGFILLTKSTMPIIGPVAGVLGLIMNLIFDVTAKFDIVSIGWSIIIFTIIINLIMLPLTIKQQKSTKLMSVMQPEIQAIQKKYKGKKDNESVMKMQAETKAVYEKYGTSMTGGCLQMAIQMPILFALYQVIMKIPAYVASVRVVYEEIANVIMAQSAYVANIEKLTEGLKIPAKSLHLDTVNGIIDVLYKFSPEKWDQLALAIPSINDILAVNLPKIESMNYFMGINLATAPWQGFMPNIAWIIPVLAGISQWYSTKLMTNTQPTGGDENAMAAQMKTMTNVMPLMSVFFCFTLPAGLGLYWIASAVCRVAQQVAINKHLDSIDIDEMIEKNIEKSNEKRKKKGLPPQSVNKKAILSAKKQEEVKEIKEKEMKSKIQKTNNYVKDSTKYYNDNAKAGSLAAKANMVAKYNEKHSKK